MNICVISGSPKGPKSLTLQSIFYLEKKFPSCKFNYLHVGQQYRNFAKDFTPVKESIKNADLVLFVYPVYTFLVPAQLHKFIEQLTATNLLNKKPVAQFTTSKHFFDITAHNFILENIKDCGALYLGGMSADMNDLVESKGQQELINFWHLIQNRFENKIEDPLVQLRTFSPTVQIQTPYKVRKSTAQKDQSKTIGIVCDLAKDDERLKNMILDFQAICKYQTKVFNILDFNLRGGCLGCLRCTSKGECIYTDGFQQTLREQIEPCDSFIFAFTVKNHSMGSNFKTYYDRQFCNGHRSMSIGKSLGFIVNGSTENEPNLCTLLQAIPQTGGEFLTGFATDPKTMTKMAQQMEYSLENPAQIPGNFYNFGGQAIFRDLVYISQGLMKEDFKFFKANGFFDQMPQNQKKNMRLMKIIGLLMGNKKFMNKYSQFIQDGMIMQHQKVIAAATPEE